MSATTDIQIADDVRGAHSLHPVVLAHFQRLTKAKNKCENLHFAVDTTAYVMQSIRMTTNTTETVKIGKTTYEVVSAAAYSRPGTVWTIRKGNETKTLIYDEQNASYTLWSGRCNLPKLVNVEFAR